MKKLYVYADFDWLKKIELIKQRDIKAATFRANSS